MVEEEDYEEPHSDEDDEEVRGQGGSTDGVVQMRGL